MSKLAFTVAAGAGGLVWGAGDGASMASAMMACCAKLVTEFGGLAAGESGAVGKVRRDAEGNLWHFTAAKRGSL